MVLKTLGALRFSGLASDFASLPVDSILIGAIFDAVDTIQKYVFDGTAWNEFVGGAGTVFYQTIQDEGIALTQRETFNFIGAGVTVVDNAGQLRTDITIPGGGGGGAGITGLNPNSTILEYLNSVPDVFTDYTTPTSATATSEDGANVAGNVLDQNTTTFWKSNAGINESISLNMGSPVNCYGLAYYLSTDAGMTETQFTIGLLGSGANTIWGLNHDLAIEDYTSYTDQGEASLNWIPLVDSAGSRVNITTDLLEINSAGDGTAYNCSYDMGAGNVSDTSWLCRFTLKWNTYNNGGGFGQCWIALSDMDQTAIFSSNQDSINIRFNRDAVILVGSSDNASMTSSTTSTSPDLVVTTTYYCEIIRNSGTATFNAYLNSDFTNLHVTGNHTIAGSPTNLRYFSFKNDNASGAGDATGEIDDIQFYNNSIVPIPDSVSTIVRTVNVSDLTLDAWNFIRFNGVRTQSLIITGNSGDSRIMSANELMVQLESDPPLTTKHGQFTINPTNASLPLNGGDPTSSVIDDPAVNSLTLNNTVTQGDPPTGAGVFWAETVDANNDGIFCRIKVDGTFQNVRVV